MSHSSQPTMKDVAREAGVALGTVSRVFNGFPVGEEYRERVEAAAEKLNYRVNNYARGLKTNKTFCVGLLMPSLRHPFFAALIDELTASLMRRGYLTNVMITNFDPDAELKCFRLIEQNKVDGIIALTYRPDLVVEADVPVVTIDRQFHPDIPCVSSDNFRGGQMAAEKLETEAPIYRFLTEHLHDSRFDFDGIFCNTDGLARRVINYLERNGVRVPDDVQIIGYDGIINFATGFYVCSTIVQPLRLMAETAVDVLLSSESSTHESIFRLPVTYVPGGTTRDGPASVGDSSVYNPFRTDFQKR